MLEWASAYYSMSDGKNSYVLTHKKLIINVSDIIITIPMHLVAFWIKPTDGFETHVNF